MHLDALSSQLNDVISNSSTPATALSLTTEAEDFSMSQALNRSKSVWFRLRRLQCLGYVCVVISR